MFNIFHKCIQKSPTRCFEHKSRSILEKCLPWSNATCPKINKANILELKSFNHSQVVLKNVPSKFTGTRDNDIGIPRYAQEEENYIHINFPAARLSSK